MFWKKKKKKKAHIPSLLENSGFTWGAARGPLHTQSISSIGTAPRTLSPLLAPRSASARVHLPQCVSFLRFRYLLKYIISGMPNTSSPMLCCTKSNHAFVFTSDLLVKGQSVLSFDFMLRNSMWACGTARAAPSWWLTRVMTVLTCSPLISLATLWSLLLVSAQFPEPPFFE